MKTRMTVIAALVIAAVAGTAATGDAASDKAKLAGVKARQASMDLRAFNLGILGSMAKGEREYDAKVASGAANSLVALTKMDGSQMWIPGSDNESLGKDVTRTLPKLWSPEGNVGEYGKAMVAAVDGLAASAGNGLDALRGAIGPVGKACGACHEQFRAPNN